MQRPPCRPGTVGATGMRAAARCGEAAAAAVGAHVIAADHVQSQRLLRQDKQPGVRAGGRGLSWDAGGLVPVEHTAHGARRGAARRGAGSERERERERERESEREKKRETER